MCHPTRKTHTGFGRSIMEDDLAPPCVEEGDIYIGQFYRKDLAEEKLRELAERFGIE
jgi:hypothetical protein